MSGHVKFVRVMDSFPKGHLFVRSAYNADGCFVAPWWSAPFLRGRHIAWQWLMATFCRRTRWERELANARRQGYSEAVQHTEAHTRRCWEILMRDKGDTP